MEFAAHFRKRYRFSMRVMIAGWLGALLMLGLSHKLSHTYANVNPNEELTHVLTADAQYQRATADQRRGMLRRAYEVFYPKEWKAASPAEQDSMIEVTLKTNRPAPQLPAGYTETPSVLPVSPEAIQRLGAAMGFWVGALFSIPWLWYFVLIRLSEVATVFKGGVPI
ncbi:MAG TPA: hypothetical protein VMT58_05915 [Candidatus Binataceae bacterium]|nr:hypothetical protein [Candidatus Binataceae bacterium]